MAHVRTRGDRVKTIPSIRIPSFCPCPRSEETEGTRPGFEEAAGCGYAARSAEALQKRDRPPLPGKVSTCSPALKVVTSLPASTISPQMSYPGRKTLPAGRGILPSGRAKSRCATPAYLPRRTISPGPARGIDSSQGYSATASSLEPRTRPFPARTLRQRGRG